MSKLDEKQIEKTHKSAAGQEDKAFEEWVSQRVLDETAEMINGLENGPDLDDFEPSEELFQKIVGIAKERGLLAEDDETTEDEADEIVEKIELFNKKSQDNVNEEFQNTTVLDNALSEKIVHYPKRRRTLIKWTAMIAVTMMGIFGISMSSQANRAYVMQRVDEIFGNDVNTKLNNTTDIIESDSTEEVDRRKIEEKLDVKVPTLFYMLDGMSYESYKIDEEAQAAYIRYKYKDKYIYLQIFSNYNDASGIFRNDQGVLLETIGSNWVDIKAELWKIEEVGDEMPVYLAQWEYGNSYYNINGKIEEEDMKNIVSYIIY